MIGLDKLLDGTQVSVEAELLVATNPHVIGTPSRIATPAADRHIVIDLVT